MYEAVRTIFECRLPSGSRLDPASGDVTYPIAEPAKPVEVRLNSIEKIQVVEVVEKR